MIYDLPVFLAYLCIIPGMAVFLVRIETDFVDFYQKFYDAVRDGGSLDYLNEIRDEMVYAVKQGIFEIIKIQGITVLIVFIAGPSLLRWARNLGAAPAAAVRPGGRARACRSFSSGC